MKSKITVIGSGNGGYAIAGDMSLKGHDVLLYEFPAFKENLLPVMHAGGISVTGVAGNGFALIKYITTEIKQAMEHSDIVFVAVQSIAHELLASMIFEYIQDNHLIVFTPGSLGTLLLAKQIRDKGLNCNYTLAETYTLPYACRKLNGPGTINIHSITSLNPIGVFPAKNTRLAINRLEEFYTSFTPAENVIEVALQNPNILYHPVGTLLNVGRIEYTKGDFWLYKEGFTDSTFTLLKAVDEEKCNVLAALGLPALGYFEYPKEESPEGWGDFAKVSSKGPQSVRDRYVVEDVPNGLHLISAFGKFYGVETPIIDSVIRLFSVLLGTDFFKFGRSLADLGIGDMSCECLHHYLQEGTV